MISVNSSDICAICKDNLLEETPKLCVELSCTIPHIFHESCLNDWKRLSLSCPICRKQIKEHISLTGRIKSLSSLTSPIFLIACIGGIYLLFASAFSLMHVTEHQQINPNYMRSKASRIYSNLSSFRSQKIDFRKSSNMNLTSMAVAILFSQGFIVCFFTIIAYIISVTRRCLKDYSKPCTYVIRKAVPVRI